MHIQHIQHNHPPDIIAKLFSLLITFMSLSPAYIFHKIVFYNQSVETKAYFSTLSRLS